MSKQTPRTVRGLAWNALDNISPLAMIQRCYALLGWGDLEPVTLESIIEDLHSRLPGRVVVTVGYKKFRTGKQGWLADIVFLDPDPYVWVCDSRYKTAMTALAATLRGVVADDELRALIEKHNSGGNDAPIC